LAIGKSFGNHNVSSFVGYSAQQWKSEDSRYAATSLNNDKVETFNNVKELNLGNTNTTRSGHALTSIFGNVSYDFSEKYLMGATIRRDGSSRFGSDRKYGYFPSVSFGWRVSSEGFMAPLKSTVSNLMIKFGYGVTGNERIGDFDSKLLYRPGQIYGGLNGIGPTKLANANLGWESTNSKNLALDLGLFKDRVILNVDLWDKTTKDLLYDVPIPQETGFTTSRQNIGSINNRGIDLSVSVIPLKTKNFTWESNFNISYFKNKVVDLADDDGFEAGLFLIQEGQPIGNMYTFVNNGIFKTDQDNAFSTQGDKLTPVFGDGGVFSKYTLNGQDYAGTVNKLKLRSGGTTLRGGDIWWKDLNNDFFIDDEFDRSINGNGLAKYFGGFNNDVRYKGFTASLFLDYNFGNNIFKNYEQQRNDLNSQNETPSPERINGAWLKQGDVAEYASLETARSQNRLLNSAYISKGDFIKFRTFKVNYRLPQSLTKRTRILENVTFGAALNNPILLTNYNGFNPELSPRGNAIQPGIDGLRYPSYREVLFNVKLEF
jgi:TonB-dependent starch-binding outer membrane protein SusC